MCGIFASLGFLPDRANIEVVSHRGPDGEGWRVFATARGPLALGHRRLAIIDLSESGHQPMSYDDGRYWLVFNGEIYNYLELRRTLETAGRTFRTESDSEVLLAAYAHWGERALDRLFGMFAFVIWDAHEQRLFAARDRFGVKPLYWVATARGFAFASEIKQLLNLPGISRAANIARLRDFLASGITEHTEQTLFADVRQLRGGECVSCNLASWTFEDTLPIRRWYAVLKSGGIDISEADAGERFRELLIESIQMHLRSDVPVGSCLSGGLDSSSIVCLMDKMLSPQKGEHSNIYTVSACYRDLEVDERPFMEAVVRQTSCNPTYIYPRIEDVFASAEKITWHQDEPYGSTSIFAQWSVFAAAKAAGVKVMLDGQGADEQLAGYHGGFDYHTATLFRRWQWFDLVGTFIQRKQFHGLSFADQLRNLCAHLLPRALRSYRMGNGRSDWLGSEAFRTIRDHRSAVDVALASAGISPTKTIGDLCVAMLQAFGLTMLLHWEDRNSMAHGIEARVPFLDHRLVEFSIALGEKHKIVQGDTKRVLRRAMSGILPAAIVNRRDKLGFATPEQRWFRGPLRYALEAGVEETLSKFPNLLNASRTRLLLKQMLDETRPLDFTLWRIVNVGIWGRVFQISV
jgi:asparagine synthase (glutamine-hydrolysing)